MRKNDFIIAGALAVLMFAWMHFFPSPKLAPKPVAEENPAATNALTQVIDGAVEEVPVPEEVTVDAVEDAAEALPAEELLRLSNEHIELTVSSHGGAVISAVLKDYPELNEPDSAPLTLDFASAPALRYSGVPLMAGTLERDGDTLVYFAPLGDGQVFKRVLELKGDYLLAVEDAFVNSSDEAWMLPALRLPTGPMSNPTNTTSMRGMTSLEVDAYSEADGVWHLSKPVSKAYDSRPFFKKLFGGSYEAPESVDFTPEDVTGRPVDWVAAKNKFFVQIITAKENPAEMAVISARDPDESGVVIQEVAAAFEFDACSVAPGQSVTRNVSTYIGPKDFGTLKDLGMDQSDVMGFKSTGFWRFMNPIMYPVKLALLWGLVHLAPFGSYGIAILILTVIVRVIFWPLTHKSTESMKRMQELQPKMKEIKEKYKDNPQRMQQETMMLYRENKVNPMGGCLPMIIQIPVFIALFRVLRSAIELRYSKFLWISDLSEPENLFAGSFKLPLIGWDAVNILPLLMAATMILQQKLMPSAAAAASPEQQQQQKMMQVMMPIMMLFFFYSMPSGLVLYYTASQVIMIAQLLIRKKKAA